MKSEHEILREALAECRRVRRREDCFAMVCNLILGLVAAALVWAVCALVSMKRDEAKETRLLEETRAVGSYLSGGRA